MLLYIKITDKYCYIAFTLQHLADLHEVLFKWDEEDVIYP